MVLALGVLVVSSTLVAATFVVLNGEANSTQVDMGSKNAYYAARAGLNAYLYQLNQNSNFWQTCSNDTMSSFTSVPGSTNGESYEYNPEYANGNTSCNSSNVTNSLIDTSTGQLTMKFLGQAGGNSGSRGIVASFKRASPLDYLWYTKYESLDQAIVNAMGQSWVCNVWYRVTGGRNGNCNINWVNGDSVKGSMYTQDQFLIGSGASPTFGRTSSDTISTLATNSVCANGCGTAKFVGTPQTGVTVPLPADNSGLLTDATNFGKVYSGTTTITLNGTTATVQNCPSSCTTTTVDITKYPIIYVQNASGCSLSAYNPFNVSYSNTGCAGDVYVQDASGANYTSSLTIAAANNIIVTGNITTTSDGSGNPTGNAVLALIANQFVRVQHGIPTRPSPGTVNSCPSSNDTIDLTNLTIDAAILALSHSFIVDNYDCGWPQKSTAALGSLNVYGSIVQEFRGPVLENHGSWVTGYVKNYNYDNRFAYLAPPYAFDLLQAGWHLTRETECSASSSASSASAC